MKANILLKLCDIFYKQASDFEAPPEFLRAVDAWASQVYAAHVHKYAKDKGMAAFLITQDPKNQNNTSLLSQAQNTIKETKRVIDVCKSIFPTPARLTIKTVKNNFPIQLAINNWKYLNEEYKQAAPYMLEEHKWPTLIPVIFYLKDNNKNIGGQWLPEKKKIEIFSGIECESLYDFNDHLSNIHDVVRHEIQHMAQDLLQNLMMLPQVVGIPSHKLRWTDTHDPEGRGLQPQHESLPDDLIDTEFYPRLKQSISEFSKLLPYESDSKKFFKWWIGLDNTYEPDNPNLSLDPDEFFESLRTNDHLKWQKAVAELWKSFH